jgi:diguanylate cyclase (GGDEF)-like protein
MTGPSSVRSSSFVRALQTELERLPDDVPRRAALLNDLARSCVVDDPSRALSLCEEARAIATRHDDREGLFQAQANAVLAHIYRSELEQARALLERLVDDAGPTHVVEVARCRTLRAIIEQRTGDLTAALASAFSAEACLRDSPWEGSLEDASTHNLIGNLLTKLADPAGAIEHYEAASAQFERLGRDDMLTVVANNVAMAHRELGQSKQAIDAFERALSLTDTSDPSYLRAAILGNLALVHIESGSPSKAFEPLRVALSACEAVGARRGQATMHHNLGLAHHATGDLARAEEHFERATTLRAELGEVLDLAEGRLRQGMLLRDLGRTDDAIALLRGILDGKGSTAWSRLRAEAHFALYEIHRARGDLAAALDHHVAFHAESRAVVDDRTMLRQQALSVRLRMRELELDTERLRAREEELERAASTDDLTGLPNRRATEQRLSVELRRARERGRLASVAVVDVDRFKSINDRFSHAVGDATLREVAKALEAALRDGDFVGRYGGEEFVVIFPGASLEAAARACERLRGALERHPWHELVPELGETVTASFGVAETGDSRSVADWLARADSALYRAKEAGRNRVALDWGGSELPS